MEEKRDVTPNSRRFPAMLVVVPMAPVCLGLLLAAATHDMAQSAEQGHANAQFALGFVYSNGEGVALDDAESLAWFRRAAEQGHDAAQWVLGITYSWGLQGTPRDDVAAYMWLHLAVSQNDGHDRSPLDQLEARMSPAQIAEAQRLAREWREAHR